MHFIIATYFIVASRDIRTIRDISTVGLRFYAVLCAMTSLPLLLRHEIRL